MVPLHRDVAPLLYFFGALPFGQPCRNVYFCKIKHGFMTTRQRLFLLSVLLAFAGVPSAKGQQATSFDSLYSCFSHLSRYNVAYTREQVFVHLDNNAYFTGDDIWYSAYVVYGSNLRPTGMSRVLYVELLNESGNVVQRHRLRVQDGRADGNFKLDETCHSGYYEIRAYTRPMLNWDEAGVFSRVVPVFVRPEQEGAPRQLELRSNVSSHRNRPADAVSLPHGAVETGGLQVGFYPEGGQLVDGQPLHAAFKVTDGQGVSQRATLRLFSADGREVGRAATRYMGMGHIDAQAQPDWSRVRAELTDEQGHTVSVSLPEAHREGAAICFNAQAADDSLRFEISATPSLRRQLLGVSITCRGEAHYLDTLRMGAAQKMLTLPADYAGQGVNELTLFTPDGRILAERLFWHEPDSLARVDVRQNRAHYGACSPVVLKVSVPRYEDYGSNVRFSMAVREAGSDIVRRAPGIREQLLLSSSVRGYVERPEYYFESADSAHRAALDLLLQVQGWRSHNWQQMAGLEPMRVRHPVEEGMLIDGTIYDGSSRRRTCPDYSLSVRIVLPGSNQLKGETRTDSLGNFSFMAPSFYGPAMGVFSARNARDKRKYCIISLHRNLAPQPRAYWKQELRLVPPQLDYTAARLTETPLFSWQDTIRTDIQLREVTVSEKGYDDYYGGRYTWMGGEEYGKKYSETYYNVADEVEQYMDQGFDVPGTYEWLAEKDRRFTLDVTPEGGERLRFMGKQVITVVDNGAGKLLSVDRLDDLRSMMVCTDAAEISRRAPVGQSHRIGCVLFLYTDPAMNIFDHRKGERITRLEGYRAPVEFYSPNYRKTEMPTTTDFRRTLYWNPDVELDSRGEATLTFYSNSQPTQRLAVSVQGFTADGHLIELER